MRFALSFAMGAMYAVVAKENIAETGTFFVAMRGYGNANVFGVMLGTASAYLQRRR